MKPSKLFAFAALALLQVTLLKADVYEYRWTGGQPGFSGSIFLDAPTSALAPHGGTVDDLMPGSFVTTPAGTFTTLNPTLMQEWGVPNIGWDETQISYMGLLLDPPTPILIEGVYFIGIANAGSAPCAWCDAIELGRVYNGLATTFADDDFTGHWLAVPEPAVMSLLLLASATLALLRRCGSAAVKGEGVGP